MASRNSVRNALVIAGLGFGTAAGIALGTLVVAPNLPSEGFVAAEDPIREEHQRLLLENQEVKAEADAVDSLVEDLAAPSVAGSLTGRPVIIIATGDASDRDVNGVREALAVAGATDAGRVTLANEFLHPESADALLAIADDFSAGLTADLNEATETFAEQDSAEESEAGEPASELPANAPAPAGEDTVGARTGQALAQALLLDPVQATPLVSVEERADLLTELKDAGFIDYEEGTILPAQAAVIITGRGGDQYYTDNLVNLVNAFNNVGTYTVFAGRSGAASEHGALTVVRGAPAGGEEGPGPVTTVEPINRQFAHMAVALAVLEQLNGGAGSYGVQRGVDAVAPPLPGQ